MAATQVKICGLSTPETVAAAAAADWIGFVFFQHSPRFVTPAQAAELAVHARPQRVGLFVEPTDADIADTLAALRLDVLQVIAGVDRAAAIRAQFGVPVWRAVPVSTAADLPGAMSGVDALLLDAKAPADATRPGGNATAFDWTILHGWAAPGPWLLAGGLHPGNVAAAIAATGAPAVDVSSGVENAPGVKNPALIAAFIEAARTSAAAAYG